MTPLKSDPVARAEYLAKRKARFCVYLDKLQLKLRCYVLW